MFLNNKAHLIGGISLLLLAACTAVVVGISGSIGGDADPFDRADGAKFLTDIAGHQGAMITVGSIGLFSDVIVALVAAAMLFVLFRDRSSILATFMLVALAVAGAIAAMTDVLNIMTTVVADDFVSGGAQGVAAGDPSTLELGRFLGMLTFTLYGAINVSFGLGLFALGSVIVFAPKGALNPPRWLGWVALVSAACCWLTPGVFINEVLFVFFPLQLLTSLIVLIGLGGWLVTRGAAMPEQSAGATALPSLAT